MSALGIHRGLLGVGKWLRSAAGRLLSWTVADWRNGPLLVLVLWGAAHILLIDPAKDRELASETRRANREAVNAETWRVSAEDWEREFNSFAADVSAKQRAAEEADRANVARVEAEFAALYERTTDEYETNLAAARDNGERLRIRLARAEAVDPAPGGRVGSAAGVPAHYTARCQAFGATDCDGLLRQLPGVLAEAQANTGKLLGLQQYVAGSALIDFSGEPEGRSE